MIVNKGRALLIASVVTVVVLAGALAPRTAARIAAQKFTALAAFATCRTNTCVRRTRTIDGVLTAWRSTGGYSSDMVNEAPEVVDLGQRVLVVWQASHAIEYLLAPLADLDAEDSRWIAEIARPEGGQRDLPGDPRMVAWPELRLFASGDAALVLVRESDGPWFPVRFDALGVASVLSIERSSDWSIFSGR